MSIDISQFTARSILDMEVIQVFIGPQSVFKTKSKNALYIMMHICLRIRNANI